MIINYITIAEEYKQVLREALNRMQDAANAKSPEEKAQQEEDYNLLFNLIENC